MNSGPRISRADINPAVVDREIVDGVRGLRFSSPIEQIYEHETGERRSREQTITAMIALLCVNLFLLADYLLIPDVFGTAIVIRLLVVSPFTILTFFYLRFNRSAFVRESISVANVIVITASTAFLMVLSHDPLREIYNHSVLLVIIYATMVQRIRFWYSVVACVAVNVIFSVALFLQDMHDLQHAIAYQMIMIVGTMFTLAAAYNLEREHRLLYLMSLKERLRTDFLEIISNRDALTGLFNRRALDARLLEMKERVAETPVSLAVVILDIDHFKIYNDSLGHQTGDACLKRVADTITAQLREGHDLAFRYGGEEFLIVVNDSDLAGACAVAGRIRKALEQEAIPHPGSSTGPYLTASFGVAHSLLGNATPDEVIASADVSLYAAKHHGRNQVWPRFDLQPIALDRLKSGDFADVRDSA